MEISIYFDNIKFILIILATISAILVISTKNAVISVFNLIVLYILVAFYLIYIGITYLGISYIVIVRRLNKSIEYLKNNQYFLLITLKELNFYKKKLNIASLIKYIVFSKVKAKLLEINFPLVYQTKHNEKNKKVITYLVNLILQFTKEIYCTDCINIYTRKEKNLLLKENKRILILMNTGKSTFFKLKKRTSELSQYPFKWKRGRIIAYVQKRTYSTFFNRNKELNLLKLAAILQESKKDKELKFNNIPILFLYNIRRKFINKGLTSKKTDKKFHIPLGDKLILEVIFQILVSSQKPNYSLISNLKNESKYFIMEDLNLNLENDIFRKIFLNLIEKKYNKYFLYLISFYLETQYFLYNLDLIIKINSLLINILMEKLDIFIKNTQTQTHNVRFYMRYGGKFILGLGDLSREEKEYLRNAILKILLESGFFPESGTKKIKFINLKKIKEKVLFRNIILELDSLKNLKINAPIELINKKLISRQFIKSSSLMPNPKFAWLSLSHDEIIYSYNSLFLKILADYLYVNNYNILKKNLGYYLKGSCAKLLAAKYNLKTQSKVYKKFGFNLKGLLF
jgi:hypothetical protein